MTLIRLGQMAKARGLAFGAISDDFADSALMTLRASGRDGKGLLRFSTMTRNVME